MYPQCFPVKRIFNVIGRQSGKAIGPIQSEYFPSCAHVLQFSLSKLITEIAGGLSGNTGGNLVEFSIEILD